MAPIAPHWSEELWHEALQQTGSVYNEPWPTLDEKQAQSDTIEIAVQVMGKLRGHAQVAKDASKDVVEETAKKAVAHYIEGKTIRKVIVVPGRLVNIVAN
jgi:leucyl-tRNA synthetase